LGYEYEYEDPLTHARYIGEQQFDGSGLLSGEENYIEPPPSYVDEETAKGWNDDDQLSPPPKNSKKANKSSRKHSKKSRKKRKKKKKSKAKAKAKNRNYPAPSRQENVMERYPDMMDDSYHRNPTSTGTSEYAYSERTDSDPERVPQADDVSPSYFEDNHHDYNDGGESHAPDYDYTSSPDDHSSHDHDDDDGHHDSDDDKDINDDDEHTEATSKTIVQQGTDDIPQDMRTYARAFKDPRERLADAFLDRREHETDRLLETMRDRPYRA